MFSVIDMLAFQPIFFSSSIPKTIVIVSDSPNVGLSLTRVGPRFERVEGSAS